jgi:PhnB protein
MSDGPWTMAPYLLAGDAAREIAFCKAAFDAAVSEVATTPEGRVMHADLRFHGAALAIADLPPGTAYAEPARSPIFLYLHVDEIDAAFQRAIAAGASVKEEPADTPYGHRRCAFVDPAGFLWYLTRPIPGAERHGRDPA